MQDEKLAATTEAERLKTQLDVCGPSFVKREA